MKVYALLTTLIVVLAIPAMSQTLVVGTCKKANHHYTTIQSAVQAAPEDATVLVCPGTYAEQVVITTPLTLKGVSVPPLNNPTIIGPSGGLIIGPIQPVTRGAASFIAVDTGGTPGPVNIQGIVIDGQSECQIRGSGEFAGILYLSTSGTIRDSVIQRMDPSCGSTSGILVENDDSRPMTVTAKNNVIRNIAGGYGIQAYSGPSSSGLSFLVQENMISQVVVGAVLDTNGNGDVFPEIT
jgi:hypothetical protein